ncbi:hypothetical protein [Streptomyces sp. NPDC090798]|uniref:hypothetical protein n=1 Tax=Streptomyces sp. NPDC090798 TaxID=3365968 RepID=UPI00380B0205
MTGSLPYSMSAATEQASTEGGSKAVGVDSGLGRGRRHDPNGRITTPARDFAEQQRPHLVDRRLLASWAAGSQPLWKLLRALPPPRRPSAPS